MIPLLSFEIVVNVSFPNPFFSSAFYLPFADISYVFICIPDIEYANPLSWPFHRVQLLMFSFNLTGTLSFRHNVSAALRSIALRAFLGSCATLTSSVANMAVMIALHGEPGWVCLMCCNADSESSPRQPQALLIFLLFLKRLPDRLSP